MCNEVGIADQPALYSLLLKIRDLGLPLVTWQPDRFAGVVFGIWQGKMRRRRPQVQHLL